MSKPYNRKDRFYEQAKSEGYRSRASFKLLELDKRFRLFRPGARVLDLGNWPGGWTQVACESVGKNGVVVGVDLKAVPPFKPAELQIQKKSQGFITPILVTGDVNSPETQDELRSGLGGALCDVLISDLSAAISGIRDRDIAQAAEILEVVFRCAETFCRDGASVVAKTFPSPDTDAIIRRYQARFKKLNRVSLDSTRKSSNEFYLVGVGFQRADERIVRE